MQGRNANDRTPEAILDPEGTNCSKIGIYAQGMSSTESTMNTYRPTLRSRLLGKECMLTSCCSRPYYIRMQFQARWEERNILQYKAKGSWRHLGQFNTRALLREFYPPGATHG